MLDLLNILERVLGTSKKSSKGNYAFFSPFFKGHRKPKLQINLDTEEDESGRPVNRWHCWLTDRKGRSIYSLLNQPEIKENLDPSIIAEVNDYFRDQRFNVFVKNKDKSNVVEQETQLPKEYKSLLQGTDIEAGIAKRYVLNTRNLTEDDIIRYGIGYCNEGKYRDRIIIPSYDENGNINYFIARDYKDKHGLKYLNPKRDMDVVGFEYYVNWNEPIVLVEGIFDAISVRRNAIPLLGKVMHEELKYKIYLNDVKRIYVALDGDATKDAIRIYEYLMQNEIETYRVDIKDKDPSDLGYLGMSERIQRATKMNFKELLKLKLGM